MKIDWVLIATIGGPIIAVIVAYLLQARPKIITWLGHTSAIPLHPAPIGLAGATQAITIHTHAVVVRNVGRRPATNVRLIHWTLPNFSVYPHLPHQRNDFPGGGAEIVFPTLGPSEQVTVTYLYFPPLIWSQIHQYTRSDDEGPARVISVLPTPQQPAWLLRAASAIFLVGLGAGIYLLVRFGLWIASLQ